MHKRILAVGMIFVMVLLAAGPPSWAAPQFQARSVITSPTDGMTVGGVVNIMGIATHPNMRFYQLRYAAGAQATGESQWVDFAIVEGTQVDNAALATWDTTTLPDGQYTLALAVWGVDDAASPYVSFVTSLIVNNAQPVETPTTESEPATPEPMPTAEAGPTATPVTVEQPPTSTPPPSPTPGEGEDTQAIEESSDGDEGGFSLPINFAELRAAFVGGGKLALLLFVLWALYLFVKALVRWLLRHRVRLPWK